jgi:hypothetical protein
MKDRLTGVEKILFTGPQNGKGDGDTSQVCNVSISSDAVHEDRVLLLDFGSGGRVSSLTNTTYGLHQYVFMVDFLGNANHWYGVPSEYAAWDNPEWSNRYGFAIASASDNSGRHRALYIISLADSQYYKIVEGADLCDPYCWIKSSSSDPVSIPLDSVGRYNDPHLSWAQAMLAYKMRFFWSQAASWDVVFVGSSFAADGIDPRYFTGFKGYNMAVGGGDLAASHLLITRYILPTCKKIRIIGVSIDIHQFNWPGATWDGYLFPTFTQSKGFLYDQSHQFWQSGPSTDFLRAVLDVPIPETGPPVSAIDSLGLVMYRCAGWGDDGGVLDTSWNGNSPNAVLNWQLIQELVDQCAQKGVHLLFVNFPANPLYGAKPYYNGWGTGQQTAKEMLGKFIDCAAHNSNVHFYDANNYGNHDYTDDETRDNMHLCTLGAKKLSIRLDSLMHTIVPNE